MMQRRWKVLISFEESHRDDLYSSVKRTLLHNALFSIDLTSMAIACLDNVGYSSDLQVNNACFNLNMIS